ncbi:MAG TPA: LysM peptidoglycan-binding domain-containing protein [Anaerolineales bacterium]
MSEKDKTFLFIGIAIILLVSVGVVVLLRRSGADSPPPITESPEPTIAETVLPSATAPAASIPTDTEIPLLTGSPVVEETPAEAGTSVYEVKEGDTLDSIARQLNVPYQTLLDLNPEIDPDLIVVGQQIRVPAAQAGGAATPVPAGTAGLVEYEIVAGDTLLEIAERFNTTVGAIVAQNGLENANDIQAGLVLQIPVNAPEPLATAAPEATVAEAPTETANP